MDLYVKKVFLATIASMVNVASVATSATVLPVT